MMVAMKSQIQTTLDSLVQHQQPMLSLLQAMKDGVVIFDAACRMVLFNPAMAVLRDLEPEHLGEPCDVLLKDMALRESIEQVLASGESITQELSVYYENRKEYFQINLVPLDLMQSEDETAGCVAIFHDMTAVNRTDKIRRDFVANVSHELRTPLSAINGYAETLLEGALDDPNVSRDFIDVIFRHSQRLAQLVSDLLDLSKLEAPDYEEDLIPVDLVTLAQKVYSMAEREVKRKNLSFSMDLPVSLPKVLANILHLEQVLTNLVDNAIKYTPEGGFVKLSAGLNEAGMVQVCVKDTGIGIPAKHIPRLFERFYRVDKARSREMGGTGLGLSIVKHIIQLHHGDIWVESEPNEGSTFFFTVKPALDKTLTVREEAV